MININDLISEYKIELHPDEINLIFHFSIDLPADKLEKIRTSIKENKAEILKTLRKSRQLKIERARRKAEIEDSSGANLIQNKMIEFCAYLDLLNDAMDSGSGILPTAPDGPNPDELREMYPEGAAYIEMLRGSESENVNKSIIFTDALEKVYDGAEIISTYKQAQAEWVNVAMKLD